MMKKSYYNPAVDQEDFEMESVGYPVVKSMPLDEFKWQSINDNKESHMVG